MGQIRRILAWRSTFVGSGQGCKDRSPNPDRVFTLWWSNNFDFHGGWCQSCDLLGQTIGDTAEHSSTTGKNNVCVQIFTDINITFHDGLEHSVMDTFSFLSDQCWLEKDFWAAETLVAYGDYIAVWQFIALFKGSTFCGSGHFSIVV